MGALYGEIPKYLADYPRSLALQVLDANRLRLLVGLALVVAWMQWLPARRASREARIRVSVRWYLEHIHRRNWPPDGNNTGLNSDFRVSLFVPHYRKNHLACVHRTATGTPTTVWRLDPTGASDPHGFVGFIFSYRVALAVPSLPANPTPQAIETYIQQTHTCRDEHDKRTWKGAAMHGFPVQISSDAVPVGVLLFECRRPGYLFAERFDFDAEICGKILAGVLTVEGGEE
jgi:hypothetical protein